MMIRVEYHDGEQQLVRPHQLKKLLSHNQISGFERSDGWAKIGEVQLRNPGGNNNYTGPERRSPYI